MNELEEIIGELHVYLHGGGVTHIALFLGKFRVAYPEYFTWTNAFILFVSALLVPIVLIWGIFKCTYLTLRRKITKTRFTPKVKENDF